MKPKVFFGVLNWGLGHATRSIPLINTFIENDFEVIIASDGEALMFLKKEFPQNTFYVLPGYNVRYPYKSIFFNIVKYLPNILKAIFNENKIVKKLVDDIAPDLIVSDNRYGFRNNNIKSILITHQVTLQLSNKFLTTIGTVMNKMLIRLFDELWIPDLNNNLLAGDLSKVSKRFNYKYLGALSRFKYVNVEKKYDVAVVLSGPEPQRSYLQDIILKQFEDVKMKSIIILGKIGEENEWNLNDNVKVKSYALSDELNEIFNCSSIIISRSGYSTILDLAVLRKKAILIPTPGQSEQEYLARYFKKNKIFYYEKQEKFDLKRSLEKSKSYSGIKVENNLLNKIIEEKKTLFDSSR